VDKGTVITAITEFPSILKGGVTMGYGGNGSGGNGGSSFVLIVVLFILLVIVGASFYN
jgi:uncharacterized protein (TIGR01732 family)